MSANLSMINALTAAATALAAAYCIIAASRTQLPWRRWRIGALLAARLALLACIAAWAIELRIKYWSVSPRVEMAVIADRSASISPEGRAATDRWIAQAREALGRRGDRLSIIEVGGEAQTDSRRAATPLAEAIDSARVTFPGDGDKRILLLSDGRATTGDPLAAVERLNRDRVRVFAVPLNPLAGESLIADLSIAPAAWRNVPTPVQVTFISPEPQKCRLTLYADGKQIDHAELRLPAGTSTFERSAAMDSDGIHTIEARAEFEIDSLEFNNSASALIDVPLAPRVIIVSETPAGASPLASVLSTCGFEVRLVAPGDVPPRFACDCLVLANVSAAALGEPRLKAIEAYVRDGGAIVFTGGNKAYAAGGYVGSAMEPVFPVLLTPKKEHPPYALAIVLDNSWSMNEGITSNIGKINLAKEIAIVAVQGLNRNDLLALVSFDSDYHTIIPPTRITDLAPLEYEVARIGAFGMTNILGGMQEGARLLQQMDAPWRHMILISDGKETETGTDYSRVLAQLARDRVTLSTIGVGLGPNEKLLNTLAFAGKGRYYHAKSISEIPATVLQEAKNLDDQLMAAVPLAARKLDDDPALVGLDIEGLPRLQGYNRSRARDHAWTPLVISSRNEPLLARMRYGRGQALAFTSSAAWPWAGAWVDSKKPEFMAFWKQSITSVLPPPSRAIEGKLDFEDGTPVFDLSAALAAGDRQPGRPDEPGPDARAAEVTMELTRLSQGKRTTSPISSGSLGAVRADSDALLLTAKGKANAAFAWSRMHGREFADPAGGAKTLQELCRATGGVFNPAEGQAFVPGRRTLAREIAPSAWLIVAALLLIMELLVRRGPAVKTLLKRRALAAHSPAEP